MPNCVVKGCKNQTSRDKKQDGITFHVFPFRDQNIKEKWIAVIRDSRKEPSWQPTSRSVVCSAHFNSDDLYYTKKGLRRVLKNGYPKILPNIIERSDNVDLSRPTSVKEEPAAIDLSIDLHFSQPSCSCAVQAVQSNSTISDIPRKHDLSQPSVKEEPAAQDLSNDLNFNQPSFSCAVQAVQSDSSFFDISRKHDLSQPLSVKEEPAAQDRSNDLNFNQPSFSCAVQAVESDSSISDILRKYKLQERVSLLEKTLKKYKRKIKTLNQKVRRLHKRNKYLKGILDNHVIEY